MAGVDTSEQNFDEIIEAAIFESASPSRPAKSRKGRKAASKKKRYDMKVSGIVSSDDDDDGNAFDDYGDDEEFDEDDEDSFDDDDDDDDDDDEDDDDGKDTAEVVPGRKLSIELPKDAASRDTMSAVAAAVDETPEVKLFRADGNQETVSREQCLVSHGKIVDKIRTDDATVSDLALLCIKRDGDSPEFVHAIAICNDRMHGVTEYHELDHAAETTVVRNTVGVQRVPWPKLSAEQERWDNFTVDESRSCKIDKPLSLFPVHSFGSPSRRRVFILSTRFMRVRRKKIDAMKAKRNAKKPVAVKEDVEPIVVKPEPVSKVDTLKITDTRTSKVPREEPDAGFKDVGKKARLMGLLKKRKSIKPTPKRSSKLEAVKEESPSPRKTVVAPPSVPDKAVSIVDASPSQKFWTAVNSIPDPAARHLVLASLDSVINPPTTPDRPTIPASVDAPPRIRRASTPAEDERPSKKARSGYCILVYPGDESVLGKVSELLSSSADPTRMLFE